MMIKEAAVHSVGQDYEAPTVELIPVATESVLCESPLPGGNEGIGFENWN